MKPEMPLPASSLPEGRWVEGQLIRSLMRSARSTIFVAPLLIPMFLGVLWTDAERTQLLLWALLGLSIAALRLWMIARYNRRVDDQDANAHLAFFGRWRHLWTLSAFCWGLTTALYFDHAPLADQFICWLVMAGLAMFSINSLSTHLATMRHYLNTLALTALAIMGWRIGVELQFRGPFYHWWLVLLLLVFWQLLRHAGGRLHETHRRNFELQYRNSQLIDSLTRQTQAALDAVEIKNRFLASAAHDIRQPVHALGLYADWLGSEPELVHEIAPKIVESTKAVNTLFDSLFDLARLDSGKIRLNVEPLRLDKLVRDLALQYRPLAEAKGLQLRTHSRPGLCVSDPILLQRLVGNLISNAIRYTQHGGVLVAVRGTGGIPRIEVWDTGIGIAPVHQREIFREFYKVPAHGGTEEGFGLGLYIVARLAAILGHGVTLSSRPGKGTVFRLRLEATDPKAAAERATASVAQIVSRP